MKKHAGRFEAEIVIARDEHTRDAKWGNIIFMTEFSLTRRFIISVML